MTARITASRTSAPRHPKSDTKYAVSGKKIVLASPAMSVTTSSASVRRSRKNAVTVANAGEYSVPDQHTPMSAQIA